MEASKDNTKIIKENEEISLKDLILKIKGWSVYVWKRKFLLILVSLLGGGLGLIYAFITKPSYIAKLTFVLEEGKSSPLGAYMGLASQFGIDLGGIGSNGAFSGDNVLELLKSRSLIEKALLTGKMQCNGKEVSLAEGYIDFNELRDKWKEKKELKDLHFPVGQPREKFTLLQDSVLNIIQKTIQDKNLLVEKPDKKLSFIAVTCTIKNEAFAKRFTEMLVNVALDLYVNTKTERNKISVDRLQKQADSLEIMLNKKTYSVAAVQDLNLNPAKQVAGVGLELAQRDKVVLQTMYGEVVKNLEMSKLAITQESPIIQIVDTPILPLEKKKLGKIKAIVIGIFVGFFLTTFFLILRKIYKEIMAE